MKDLIQEEKNLISGLSSDSLHTEDLELYNLDESKNSRERLSVKSKHLDKGKVLHAVFVTNLIPALGFFGTIISIFYWSINATQLIILAVGYLFTMMGAEIGFHRLFTHRSFKTKKWMEVFLGIMACMCAQGPLVYWIANHRRHHQYSDKEGIHIPRICVEEDFGAP